MKIIGKNGYISKCFQEYMSSYADDVVKAISVRDVSWKNMSFAGFYAIFNTTALAHNNARKGTDEEFMNLNVKLPFELVKRAKLDKDPIFIHMSCLIVYGNPRSISKINPISRATILNPDNIY